MKIHLLLTALLLNGICAATAFSRQPVKVFVVAGDENMLRQGAIDGIPRGPGAGKVDAAEAAAKPATLHKLVKENPRYATLGNPQDGWAVRSDVALYDAHPLYNNTREPARLLSVPSDPGDPRGFGVGVDLMFGHVVGEATQDPVLLIRFATRHPIWFRRGSRSLGYDFLSPSGGGGLDLDGGWDVIHFNHGVWDQATLDAETGKRTESDRGRIRNSIEEYEKNLRTIVARLVDQWIDLNRYLLNGQEYLELIDSIQTVLADIDRYAPAFAGHTPELAGFVWFQGIADAGSPAFSAAYGHNLKGFIQDVRKDLNAPELPFVVAAIGQHGDKMRDGQRAVHGAQMAIANELENVTSIDTASFHFPDDQSPGGREWDFHRNAETFLLIGEAMGKAMLEF